MNILVRVYWLDRREHNQYWVCNFEEMGRDMFLRKQNQGNYCALLHKLVWV